MSMLKPLKPLPRIIKVGSNREKSIEYYKKYMKEVCVKATALFLIRRDRKESKRGKRGETTTSSK